MTGAETSDTYRRSSETDLAGADEAEQDHRQRLSVAAGPARVFRQDAGRRLQVGPFQQPVESAEGSASAQIGGSIVLQLHVGDCKAQLASGAAKGCSRPPQAPRAEAVASWYVRVSVGPAACPR